MNNNVLSYPYPDHEIDPREKGFDWILQYMKAAWCDNGLYTPLNMFWNGRNRFAEIKSYAMGKQTINKYKKMIPGDEVNDNTELNLDSTVVSLLPKYRNIGIAKIMQREFTSEVFAVDPLSKTEEDEQFNQMKVKVMMREVAQEQGSQLANDPMLQRQPEEPEDMQQLLIKAKYSFKHNLCMETEEGVELIKQQNGFDRARLVNNQNRYDYGLAGWKVWLDNNGMVKFRPVNAENVITSYCIKGDFSDAVHIGEVLEVFVADLAPYFDKAQMMNICKNVAGKFGNPSQVPNTGRFWDRFKVLVLDLQFFSWNTTVYKDEVDSRGNERFGATKYKNINFVKNQYEAPVVNMANNGLPADYDNEYEDSWMNANGSMYGGEAQPVYMANTKKVVYKGKWIIDTELMYDYGLQENIGRTPSSWWDCKLDYILDAWNFYRMEYSGITEWLIPIADAYMLTWRKLQNLKNKLIPYLITLDLNALEATGLGKGGKNMTPDEIIDFAFSNFILLWRSNDLIGSNPNYKAMQIEASGQLQAFAQLYQDMVILEQQMRAISGLNEITDGSAPDPKNLNSTNEAAIMGTNNALYLISEADKQSGLRLSEAIMLKIQIALRLGKVEGYVKPLGAETVKFLQINPEVANREFGLFYRDAPTKMEREQLIADLNLKDSQGLLDPSDKIIIMSCTNLKQAAELLAYTVEKRKEQQHQQQLELITQQAQTNQQATIAAEQAKQQTIQIQCQCNIQEIIVEKKMEFMIEQMKKGSDMNEAQIQAQAKVISGQAAAEAKIISQQIAAEAAKSTAKAKKTA